MKLITLLSSACTLAAPSLAYLHIYGNIASDPFVGASVWSIFAVDDGQIVCISDMSSRINQDRYFSMGCLQGYVYISRKMAERHGLPIMFRHRGGLGRIIPISTIFMGPAKILVREIFVFLHRL
jgi:hypothetical protein